MKTLLAILFAMTPFLVAAAPPDKAREELNIQEAAIRYGWPKKVLREGDVSHAFYFLATFTGDRLTDPDDALVKRFAGSQPPMKKMSAVDPAVHDRIVDKETGKRGTRYNIGPINWISPTEVQVGYGYYSSPESGANCVFCLKKIKGQWTVFKTIMGDVS